MSSRARRSSVVLSLAAVVLSCSDIVTPPVIPPPPLLDVRTLLVWSDAGATGNVQPTFDAEAVYHMSFLHRVSSFSKTAGGLRWVTTLPVSDPSRSGTGLLVAGGVVVAGDRDLFGLDRNSGAILWRHTPSTG